MRNEKTLSWFLKACSAAALVTFTNGLTIKLLWLWFMVPLGARSIAVAHAAGLGIAAGFLKSKGVEDSPNLDRFISDAIAVALTALIMGGICRLFM